MSIQFVMAVMVAGFFLGLPVNAIIISVGGATLLRLAARLLGGNPPLD